MIAVCAGIQPLAVEIILRFFPGIDLVNLRLDILKGIILRRLPQQAALAFFCPQRITNFTTAQGGMVALKPSAFSSKSLNATVFTVSFFSKVL